MGSPIRNLTDLIYVAIALWMQWRVAGWLLASPAIQRSGRRRTAVRTAFWIGSIWLVGSNLYAVATTFLAVPSCWWLEWLRGLSLAWGLCLGGFFALGLMFHRLPKFSPGRRRLFVTARAALFAAPVAAVGVGVLVERNRFHLRRIDISVSGLPKDLDGLRLVHLSDIHLSPFLEERDLRRVIDMANRARPHLAVITGDMITLRADRLSDCLNLLRNLRAEAGIFGCFGNHESLAGCRRRASREGEKLGIRFLRGEALPLHFGSAVLNLAGVDHQWRDEPYLAETEQLLDPSATNLLLSHNPAVFPVAADQGWDVTLSGHTHGGQVTIPFLEQYLNVARVFTPYVYGLYRKGKSSIYVTRGIGTVAVPTRIGAPPEIGLIKLCAT